MSTSIPRCSRHDQSCVVLPHYFSHNLTGETLGRLVVDHPLTKYESDVPHSVTACIVGEMEPSIHFHFYSLVDAFLLICCPGETILLAVDKLEVVVIRTSLKE